MCYISRKWKNQICTWVEVAGDGTLFCVVETETAEGEIGTRFVDKVGFPAATSLFLFITWEVRIHGSSERATYHYYLYVDVTVAHGYLIQQ